MRATRKTAIAAALALLCQGAYAVNPTPLRVAVAIEQQPLRTALKSLADQTGLQIMRREEDASADGMMAPRVVGEMSPKEALDKLLANSGLTYRFLNDRTVRILKVDEQTEQSSEAPAPASERVAQAESVGADTGILQEVVVSARRREEALTAVPASVTAYSADLLQKQNIQSFADYATKIPNLTFQYGQASGFSATGFSGGRVTTIRGVAGSNTTAYYLNDTPIPASVSPETLGLDRIEVLKGPQGTLFGASSMGGNLRFITRKPSLTESSFAVEAQAGHTHSAGADYGLNALADIVLIPDTMALDVAFGYLHESGFITRRFPDPYPSGNLVSKDDQGRNNLFSGSVSLHTKLTDQLEVTLSALGQDSTLMGYPATYVPLPGYEPLSYTIDRDRDVQEYSKDRWGLGSVVLNYSGTGFSFISSTSYFSRRVKEQEDGTEGTNRFIEDFYELDLGDPALPTRNTVTDRRFTHESRVSFDENLLIPHVSGIAGVFYQRDTLTFIQPGIVVPALVEGGFDPAYMSDFRFPAHEDNKAVFGELYHELIPKLTVTLGLRQYWIKQRNDAIVGTGFLSAPGGDFSPATRNEQSGRVPKVVVSYKIGEQGNVYASAAKGFRAGGAQPGLTDDFCSADLAALGLTEDDIKTYKPDTLWSYELGAKNNMADGRITLSSALFQIDWSSMQQSVLLPTCTLSFISNAGKARIRGGELEVSAQPLATVPLTVQLGLGYSDGVLRDPGLLPLAANTQLAQVPEFTGSIAGYYQTPITNTLDLFVGADYAYTDSVKVANSDGGFVTRRPFNILNGNVGLRFGDSEFLIYGKNLLNKHLNYGDLYANGFERLELLADGSLQRLPRAAVSRPRQVGVQYRLRF
jgi:iron complex outermembrane recepter protein